MARNNSKRQAKGSAGQNKNLSDDFLTKYKNKAGVIECDSGLCYRVLDPSVGDSPTLFDRVSVHQRILLVDGSVIADTYKTGLKEKFSLAEAIEGLQEGLQLMSLGARYEFVIPAELAWGKKGNGGKIGANALMMMDVRLLAID